MPAYSVLLFFFSSRRRHTRWTGDWSSDVCSSDLREPAPAAREVLYRVVAGRECRQGRSLVAQWRELEVHLAERHREAVGGHAADRSEERRVGKEGGRRWWGEVERRQEIVRQRGID